jgi:hypothetical protein
MSAEKPIKLGPSATMDSPQSPPVAPFDRSKMADDEPQFDVNPFTPRHKGTDEPPPAQGIDLTGQNKIIFAVGRGKTGKTTLLRWMAETALAAGRPFLMADIDPTNASFASYFEGVSRPDTDDPAGVNRWLQAFLEYAVKHQTTAMIDLGGGDTTLRTLATEMPGFAQQIEEAGLVPVNFYLAGAQPDDLAPIATINLWMPRLHAADAVESRRSSFAAARDGQTTPPLGIFDRSRVKSWLEAMDRQFLGVKSWMP